MSLTVELQAPHGLSQPEGLDYRAPKLRSPGTALAILAAKSPEETARFLAVAVSVQTPRLALRGELSAASPTTVAGDEEQGGAGWVVAGVLAGIEVGSGLGVCAAYAASAASGYGVDNSGTIVAACITGSVVLGVGGYFLGRLAQEGSTAARITVVTLVVIGTIATVLGILAGSLLNGGHID
jgi:hypothetical protein